MDLYFQKPSISKCIVKVDMTKKKFNTKLTNVIKLVKK